MLQGSLRSNYVGWPLVLGVDRDVRRAVARLDRVRLGGNIQIGDPGDANELGGGLEVEEPEFPGPEFEIGSFVVGVGYRVISEDPQSQRRGGRVKGYDSHFLAGFDGEGVEDDSLVRRQGRRGD